MNAEPKPGDGTQGLALVYGLFAGLCKVRCRSLSAGQTQEGATHMGQPPKCQSRQVPTDLPGIARAAIAASSAFPRGEHEEKGHWVRQGLQEYYDTTLLPHLCGQFPNEPLPGLGIVGLLACLGPRENTPPPRLMVKQLIDLAFQYPDRCLVELVLAYGVGWKRFLRRGWPWSPWFDHLPGALQEVTCLSSNYVIHALRVLGATVRGFEWPRDLGTARSGRQPDGEQTEAGEPGAEPAEADEGAPKDAPDTTKAEDYAYHVAGVFTSPQARTGPQAQKLYQSVKRWDPDRGNLYGWLQLTIQGNQKRGGQKNVGNGRNDERFVAGKFAEGTLYPLLEDEKRLLCALVAFHQCRGSGSRFEYETGACAQCQVKSIIVPVKLLIVPDIEYVTREFRKCARNPRAHGYYEADLDSCPLGGEGLSRRPTHLFVRWQFGRGRIRRPPRRAPRG